MKLIVRWYMDASYPSMVAHYLYKLGLVHGHAKIQYTLLSMVRDSFDKPPVEREGDVD